MLQAIREKVTGWIAYGVIFLISIPFALWGINSYFGGGELPPAATVNGDEITARDLDQAYANYRQRLSQLFGGSIPDSFGGEAMLRERVLTQLIEETALRQYAQEHRYRVGDQELNQVIRDMDVFQRDGRFDTSIYQAQLRSLGYSPLGFEEELRRNRSMQQVQIGIEATAFTVPAVAQQFANLENQKRSIRTLKYSVDPESIEITDDEIEQHYETQKERYRVPEKLKIDYIELSLDHVKQTIEVSEEDAYARYLEHKDAYSTPEVREASHILIKAGNDQESDAALAKIREIRERIVNGEDFAAMAREYSQDPGSAADGGDLGDIERGVMMQSFEDALFSMKPGQLSEPVKTAFGWHLIKLRSVQGGDTSPFEEVRASIEDEIRTQRAESQIFDLVESLSNLAYEQPDSLHPAAEQLGLPLQTSDWFDRNSGEGIAAERSVRQKAFSDEVLEQGLNSEAIELDNNRVVFIRLNDRREPALQPLADVRDQVVTELRALKTRELNLQAGDDALEQLRAGKKLEEVAEAWSTEITDSGFVSRNQPDTDALILQRAFSMSKPDQGKTYDGLLSGDGDYVVIELTAVVSSDAAEDSAGADRLAHTQAAADYQALLQLLTSRAEVRRTPLEQLE